MNLDRLPPIQAGVGYGKLGVGGSLGYEGKWVSVQGRRYEHAVSSHPPARVMFQLDGRFGTFRCHAALNDDVPVGISHAHFTVLADGREVASAPYVVAGDPPRALEADVRGAHFLELAVTTGRWEYCHAVWLDPQVEETASDSRTPTLMDCLHRAEIVLPATMPRAERCIAAVTSPGYEFMLDDLLGSLCANGGCQDGLVVIFAINADAGCAALAAKYGATLIHCTPKARVNATSKALLYSAARVIDARQFLCLDADMQVLGDLGSVFSALDACPEGSILACSEGNHHGFRNLGQAFADIYGGNESDLLRLLPNPNGEANYPLVVNDGLFAGGRTAMLALDGVIRTMPNAAGWIDQRRDIWWRNQFVFNLALARLGCGVELDPIYNLQLHAQDVELSHQGGQVRAEWQGRHVRVLHFSGVGRKKFPELQGRFARVPDPLVGSGAGDSYELFLRALRAWIGKHGLSALAWSFYGTTDARSAQVHDPSMLPLFALLHYLARANGCVRILETGTARGVSAACLASAVAHHQDAQVVTFDPHVHPERADLWQSLPKWISQVIEPRALDSLEGMAAAIALGERYEAALLDSVHTAEHVWAEFELAAKLVCPGGIIMIHDACYEGGTVQEALQRIEAAGYGVVRLWAAEGGVPEDDHLGLALIENRPLSQVER